MGVLSVEGGEGKGPEGGVCVGVSWSMHECVHVQCMYVIACL